MPKTMLTTPVVPVASTKSPFLQLCIAQSGVVYHVYMIFGMKWSSNSLLIYFPSPLLYVLTP